MFSSERILSANSFFKENITFWEKDLAPDNDVLSSIADIKSQLEQSDLDIIGVFQLIVQKFQFLLLVT